MIGRSLDAGTADALRALPGAELVAADDLTRALELSRQQDFDLVVSDDALLQWAREHAGATRDPLTGLPSGMLLNDRLDTAVARAARARNHCAVACIELEGLDTVVERHGAASGDALVAMAAGRLTRHLRASDTAARVSRNRFALVLEGLSSLASAEALGLRMHAKLAAPYPLRIEAVDAEVGIRIGVGVGIAIYPDHAKAADGLVTLAEAALQVVGRAGGGVLVHASTGEGLPKGGFSSGSQNGMLPARS